MAETIRLLTTTQTAVALGLTVDTVRHAIYEKRLPAQYFGRQWLVSPEAVEDYRLNRLGNKGWASGRRHKGAQ